MGLSNLSHLVRSELVVPGLSLQGCFYSKQLWRVEIMPFSRAERQACLLSIRKDSGSLSSSLFF